MYRDGKHGEPGLLSSAYRSSLDLAVENNLSSVAFPSISTGVYGYPVEEAATVALSAVISFVKEREAPSLVRFVLFSDKDLAAYGQALRSLA